MKYVVYKRYPSDNEQIIIFPECMSHSDINVMFKEPIIISAGMFKFVNGQLSIYGDSVTLNVLNARDNDRKTKDKELFLSESQW
ncbi:MAG: hypothetical protein Q7R33_00890 [Nitrosarchaeum sp.]|nr:hypothetical protein [Nitrosarchaeum sp.]